MSPFVFAGGILGLAFAVYAIRKPHWPNGFALGMIWQATKMLGCCHTGRQWRVERGLTGQFTIVCPSCQRHQGPAPHIVRPA